MRLLNTKSLQFGEFFDSQIPKYAILSHRWGDDEVTFQEFRKGKKQEGQGYAKIRRCCALAENRGFDWVWIDTCCIDKKSSAELSEAINSMFRWYGKAGECYAHLSDIAWESRDLEASKEAFRLSLWFTRGWTLQELLAPNYILFLDREWKCIGTKKDFSEEISAATGIRGIYLKDPRFACVATKMSWVSRRATSRIEDMAYCMLGLFDVNMPLLYGEGQKAFMRLQLEIIKKSDDESIFAWTFSTPFPFIYLGILASKPRNFADSGDIEVYCEMKKERFPYVMTNQGLEFHVPYNGPDDGKGEFDKFPDDNLSLTLNCWRASTMGPLAITLQLRRVGYPGDTWQRVNLGGLNLSKVEEESAGDEGKKKQTALIHIPQKGL